MAHIWVDNDGKLIRGTIEDAHTGTRLAIDISALAALLRESLAHTRAWNTQEEQDSSEKGPEEIPEEDPSGGEANGV